HAPPPGLEPEPHSSKGCRAAITPRRTAAARAARQVCHAPTPLPCANTGETVRGTRENRPAGRGRDNGRMSTDAAAQGDEVDRIVAAWDRQRPDLDFSPLEVLSRVDRLSHHLD